MDEEDVPSADECQRRCDLFVETTNTNAALAQMFLQENNWSVEAAVNAYFATESTPQVSDVICLSSDDDDINVDSDAEEESNSDGITNPEQDIDTAEGTSTANGDAIRRSEMSPESPVGDNLLKFITYNVDGLDPTNRVLRTEAVCEIIKGTESDVVFLQEVVPETYALFETNLGSHFNLYLNQSAEVIKQMGVGAYYTVTAVRKRRLRVINHISIPFDNTMMARTMGVTCVKFCSSEVFLLNAHLESTKDASEQRVAQMRRCFRRIAKIAPNFNVIFAGDLNARDTEVSGIGVPSDVCDVWEKLGSRKECEYTWDMMRNDNLTWNGRFKPRCRFDRIYFRSASENALRPKYFGLVGLERLRPHRCFPSDHWGLYAHFEALT